MKKLTTVDFIARARKIHGDKYNYSKSKYINSRSTLIITCPEHGDFEQLANNHLQYHGCPDCASTSSSIIQRHTILDFIRRARIVHGDIYDYSKSIYSTNKQKLIITCPEHGDFEQRADCHLNGQSCSKCNRSKSKIANKWLDSLNISEEHRELSIKEFPRRPVDAYVAETNTVYQFHGDYWHGNSKIYESSTLNAHNNKTMGELYDATIKWEQTIRDLNYNLVVIWESDYLKNSLMSN